ncbi:negative regulator of systemic acquired resistance SNI1-like isoform X1 [Arachis hypogaea]
MKSSLALQAYSSIKDLDISRKKADLEGHTTRADGLRKPLMDIILDQLAYNIDTIPLFLKTFSEPKWKLEIVVHYLWKYMTKPSVHTRKSNGSPEDATFEVALKCFSNKTGTKSTIKIIGPDVMQFLVGHRYSFFVILVGRWLCNRSNGLIPVI